MDIHLPPYVLMTWIMVGYPLIWLVVSYILTGKLVHILNHKQIVDVPNARSNHHMPVPRGGGIAITCCILAGWAFAPLCVSDSIPVWWSVWCGGLCLALLSFADDLYTLSAPIRLMVQAVVIVLCLPLLHGPVFQGILPGWLDMTIAALGWLWFINLFNFMDGIDGISGTETVFITAGIAMIALLGSFPDYYLVIASIIGATTLGFLWWNWHPARIFMGDVGSIPLGFFLGFLLLQLASYGYLAIAFILPAYYVSDASITLIRRFIAGKKIWEAHSEHFYQQAVRSGASHAQVVKTIALLNLLLLLLAALTLWAILPEWFTLICAYAASFTFIYTVHRYSVSNLFSH